MVNQSYCRIWYIKITILDGANTNTYQNFCRYLIHFVIILTPKSCTRPDNLRTYFINMQIPVFSIALEMPFHEASMEYFCFAVRGSLGSVAGGGPSVRTWLFDLRSDAANLPSWQPIATTLLHKIDITHLH